MRRSRTIISVLGSAIVLFAAACQHDGRSLRPANPDQKASIYTPTTTTTEVPSTFPSQQDPTLTLLPSDGLGASVGQGSTTDDSPAAGVQFTVVLPWSD
ncbi:MAG TPA: hypothetical protein VGM78_11625, partial [Ilumatobacteraceae bacterium]